MSLEGILNLNKPQGITSHDVVQVVRQVSGIKRVGHAGTLDPLATGVILVCIGRATRLVEYLVGQSKSYVARIRLGQVTDTYDAEGDIVSDVAISVSEADISQAAEQFRGRIQQQAPAYSAIKRDGQPLYKLARAGKQVDPPVREVSIFSLELRKWEEPFLELEVSCSSGTYVRSLAHDLGQALGCGGHITALERTSVGNFDLANAVALDTLLEDTWSHHLLPSDQAVQHLPRVELSSEEAARIKMGQQIMRHSDDPQEPLIRIYEPDGRFLGVARYETTYWQPHKVFLPQT